MSIYSHRTFMNINAYHSCMSQKLHLYEHLLALFSRFTSSIIIRRKRQTLRACLLIISLNSAARLMRFRREQSLLGRALIRCSINQTFDVIYQILSGNPIRFPHLICCQLPFPDQSAYISVRTL